jgi:hypothetical protein
MRRSDPSKNTSRPKKSRVVKSTHAKKTVNKRKTVKRSKKNLHPLDLPISALIVNYQKVEVSPYSDQKTEPKIRKTRKIKVISEEPAPEPIISEIVSLNHSTPLFQENTGLDGISILPKVTLIEEAEKTEEPTVNPIQEIRNIYRASRIQEPIQSPYEITQTVEIVETVEKFEYSQPKINPSLRRAGIFRKIAHGIKLFFTTFAEKIDKTEPFIAKSVIDRVEGGAL